MQKYEIVALFEAAADGIEASSEQLSMISGHVATNGGSVTSIHQWGRRRLAYEIDKRREAFYALFKVDIDPPAIQAVQEALRLESSLVRFLFAKDEGGLGPILDDDHPTGTRAEDER